MSDMKTVHNDELPCSIDELVEKAKHKAVEYSPEVVEKSIDMSAWDNIDYNEILKKLNKNDDIDMPPEMIPNIQQPRAALAEAKKQTFYIAKVDGTFEEVNGTKLTDDLFAYKCDGNYIKWVITDTATGRSIKTKLDTLAACKDWLENGMTDEQRILLMNKRLTDEYRGYCDSLQAWKDKLADKSFDTMMEELNSFTNDADIAELL